LELITWGENLSNNKYSVFSVPNDTIKLKGNLGIDSNKDGIIDNLNYPTGFSSFYIMKYELSEQQYPACFVQSGNETRTDQTISFTSALREAVADYVIVGYVKGTKTNIDTKRNELITTIETSLNSDRTRGGFAKQTQIVEVSTDEGVLFPIGGIRMVVRVMYQYTSGTP
jgi:hypothetical protein